MGYESRIFFVEKSTLPIESNGKVYAHTIAMYDACVWPSLREAFCKPTDCFIYHSDGNTEILEDAYGKPLKELPIKEFYDHLKSMSAEDMDYRRYKPLKKLAKGLKDWHNVYALHYGY